jgi:hypothetical protein
LVYPRWLAEMTGRRRASMSIEIARFFFHRFVLQFCRSAKLTSVASSACERKSSHVADYRQCHRAARMFLSPNAILRPTSEAGAWRHHPIPH